MTCSLGADVDTLRRKCYRDWNISDYGRLKSYWQVVVGETNWSRVTIHACWCCFVSGLGLIKYGADYFSASSAFTNDSPVLRKAVFVINGSR